MTQVAQETNDMYIIMFHFESNEEQKLKKKSVHSTKKKTCAQGSTLRPNVKDTFNQFSAK